MKTMQSRAPELRQGLAIVEFLRSGIDFRGVQMGETKIPLNAVLQPKIPNPPGWIFLIFRRIEQVSFAKRSLGPH